jgi:putative DNA primase/helicase
MNGEYLRPGAQAAEIARRQPGRPNGPARKVRPAASTADTPSEDAVALAFVQRHDDHRFVAPWHRWLRWDGKRWCEDSTGRVYQRIRDLVRSLVKGSKAERSTANASFVSGVERLLRTDQRIVLLPDQLDADPWALNTHSGIVDLRTGTISPHDPARLCTRITTVAVDAQDGAALWRQFLDEITQGSAELEAYLQRVAGYCATGVTSEDVLVYLFGVGANGKGSFAEAVAHVLGDYAKMFAAEVLMESKGERHPTDLAQFLGVRFALTSEPGSGSTWNDARIKSLTGDTVIAARFMRADFFTFPRTHKTMVLGNNMPRLAEVTHAIRRRVQMVPFRAVFEQTPGPGMRERLKAKAGGAILAWIVEGAQAWLNEGTAPPGAVREMTADYLDDQDLIGQWLDECCERDAKASERLSDLHRDYAHWCERQGTGPKSNLALSAHLVSAGFRKASTMVGKVFYGLRKRSP